MAYTTLVAGTNITSSWANASVRDQVVSPFGSTAARTAAITGPIAGMVSTITTNTATEGVEVYNSAGQWRKSWNMPWGYVANGYLAAISSATSGLNWAAVFTWSGTGLVANRRYLMQASVALEPSNLGQGVLELGSGIGSGTEARAQWYANGTSWINTISTASVFTTTAGAMTRYVSMRMSSGTGGIRALDGSTYQITDIGPAGAPA